MSTHTTIQGDCWDMLALKYYGTEKLCHLIMQANPEYLDVMYFSAGVTLTIPDNPNSEYSYPPSPLERQSTAAKIPQTLQDIIDGTGIMISRSHNDLTNRDSGNQHTAGAIVYKDKALDVALNSIEKRISAMESEQEHPFLTPTTEWVIVHKLGKRKPNYILVGMDGVQVVGAINWDEATDEMFTVRFMEPVAGRAYVSK